LGDNFEHKFLPNCYTEPGGGRQPSKQTVSLIPGGPGPFNLCAIEAAAHCLNELLSEYIIFELNNFESNYCNARIAMHGMVDGVKFKLHSTLIIPGLKVPIAINAMQYIAMYCIVPGWELL
jgi:hypothetical protein